VCVDAAYGLSTAAQFISLTIISFTFEFMMNSKMGVTGTMWYFAGWNLFGVLYCIFVLKETQGLTDFEKKQLYSPLD
jgi:hypothetical protein